MNLIDSHCHINFPEFKDDLKGVLGRMNEANVQQALCVSVNIETLGEVLKIAQQNKNIFASAGVHPNETEGIDPDVDQLIKFGLIDEVVAIGETGLDYFRAEGDLTWQKNRFRNHIRAARSVEKPIIIHTRAAGLDTLKIMKEEKASEIGGVMHCFTEKWEVAEAAIEMGFMISFSGIITFKNAELLRDVVKKTPLSSILIETDSPYLAPVPHRGKTNEPSYVRFVADEIARLKEISIETVAEVTTANFKKLFASKKVDLTEF